MCELATLAAGASLLGTATSAFGAIQQGQAQSGAAAYQAAVDRNNATIAGWNATIAEQSQEQKTQAIERSGTLRLGAQRAALGASGVGLSSGSAMDVQTATAMDTDRQAQVSQYQGELTGYGYRTQQQNFLTQAAMSDATSANASTAGFIGAGSSILSGAGQVADRWYRMNGPQQPTYGSLY